MLSFLPFDPRNPRWVSPQRSLTRGPFALMRKSKGLCDGSADGLFRDTDSIGCMSPVSVVTSGYIFFHCP